MFILIISYTRTLHTRTAIHRHLLGGVTSRRRAIELAVECLLVIIIIIIIQLLPACTCICIAVL